MDAARRRSFLVAALAAVRVKSPAPELSVVHAWLDTWSGLGRIVGGMQRQGYELTLKGRARLDPDLNPRSGGRISGNLPTTTLGFPSLPSMRTDFLSRHICSSPLRLLTERPAPFHRHCLRWLPAWRAPLEGAVARFHYPSIRACRRMMSSAVVDACCVEGGASQSISGPQDHGKGRER